MVFRAWPQGDRKRQRMAGRLSKLAMFFLEGDPMKEYLQNKLGQKLGVTRAGFPKEVYFEARLDKLGDNVAVFTDDDGGEIALPLDKIILVGPPEESEKENRSKPGFM